MLNNWGLCKDNQKRVFTIPINGISREEAEKVLADLLKSYNDVDEDFDRNWRTWMIEEKQKVRREKLNKIEENSTTNYYLPMCKRCGEFLSPKEFDTGNICVECELKEKREKRKEKIEEIIKNNKKIDETRRSI